MVVGGQWQCCLACDVCEAGEEEKEAVMKVGTRWFGRRRPWAAPCAVKKGAYVAVRARAT